jgi:hypothetical protein
MCCRVILPGLGRLAEQLHCCCEVCVDGCWLFAPLIWMPCRIGALRFMWHIAVCTEGLIWNKHACYPLLNNRSIEG